MKNLSSPKIVGRRETKFSKWITVVERDVVFPDDTKKETYFSVRPYDYVCILAVTKEQRIPLVQQYRPVLEAENLELPGGLIDNNMTPGETALAELRQETGLTVPGLEPLGTLVPDPGRLDNRIHGFFAPNAEIESNAIIEKRIKLVWTDWSELRKMIIDGRFTSCPQIAFLALASLKGYTKNFKI